MFNLASALRHVHHFPKHGIDFIDITPVLQDADLFREVTRQMAEQVADLEFDLIVGSESRGFIMGAPLALHLNKGFVPVRKKGKLPYKTVEASYDLEYGSDVLAMHIDAVKPGQKVLIVDDLLATGGTAMATCKLVEQLGGEIVGLLFFIELEGLAGRQKLSATNYPLRVVVKMEENPLLD